ncbi:valine--pyruvate transaminase [Simiduia curdlanivorans]|uniref:Valine--pyruvate transaminase n=1 Tax=Simiduia curdlanivorans TaxID=1492769 RepID=A0ABV8UYR2_9GAMM|nr:valine--pyruvate transaminase [Simiduia curdlanivorans]MDN3640446.1 valine--pyruvate transaminase [Simiduia curdlanivorans]
MKLSAFGQKFAGQTGASSLMDDLGSALNDNPDMLFMGGGNPSRIPAMELVFKARMQALVDYPEQLFGALGVYKSPQGDTRFLKAMADLLKREQGWELTERNIAVSNGSQSAFFVLFNLFAGTMDDGSHRYIQLPLAPEYLGYADSGLSADFFHAAKPEIELLDYNLFKYHVDFKALNITPETAAICVSRPTNPTGNVISDAELAGLNQLALAHNVPLIIDNAYGTPFPNILFTQATPLWNENTILLLSLSKLGLPGARTGIVVASEKIIRAFSNANAVLNLASGNLGPALVQPMVESGELIQLGREVVGPHYQRKVSEALAVCRAALAGTPFRVHKPEGAIFLWLWFPDLPITSAELYQRLKARGVLVVSGHYFFPGLSDDWRHRHECLRVNYAQDADTVQRGFHIIGEEVRRAYAES